MFFLIKLNLFCENKMSYSNLSNPTRSKKHLKYEICQRKLGRVKRAWALECLNLFLGSAKTTQCQNARQWESSYDVTDILTCEDRSESDFFPESNFSMSVFRVTVAAIEAFLKNLTSSFLQFEQFLWAVPENLKSLHLTWVFWLVDKQEVVNFLRNFQNFKELLRGIA